MIIYMDGGSQTHPERDANEKRQYMLSWGIVAHHNDETVELHGCKTPLPQKHQGAHERFAFIEAAKHARALDVEPQSVSFITDDSEVYHANLDYVKYKTLRNSEVTVKRLKTLCDEFYCQDTLDTCLDFLKFSRFTKVKGHSRTVYNLRADELSCVARRMALGDLSPILPFEEWLHDGFMYYDREQQQRLWYPPFSNVHLPVEVAKRNELKVK